MTLERDRGNRIVLVKLGVSGMALFASLDEGVIYMSCLSLHVGICFGAGLF